MSFGHLGSLGAGFGKLGARGGSGVPAWLLNPNGGRPSIDMDFANSRYYGRSLSDLTVSRASVGYASDNSGNWTQFGNNALRITNYGLLVEEARTNLFLYSGTPATQTINVTNGSTYSVSLIGSGSLTLSGAMSGTVTQGTPVIAVASSTSLTVTTSGVTGAFVNAQVERGASVTSPIRTTNAAATRAADVITLAPPTFGSAYSLYVQGVPQSPNTYTFSQNTIQVDNGTNSQRLVLRRSTSGGLLSALVGGSGVNLVPSETWGQLTSGKFASAVTAGSQSAAFNGGTPVTGSAASLPTTPTVVHVGSNATGTEAFNGFVERIAVWPSTRIPDAQLQNITDDDFVYLTGADGAYLTGADGAYLLGAA